MKIQTYSTKELAMMYFDSEPSSSTRQLKSWIERNKELKIKLIANGYSNRQRIWTPKQVELLFHYLGEP
ncbi:hypothetical protein B5F77_15350 [Parabacteroides sp. An277]|uniref:DUF4248 domain-containing protein n=1 Tax=Parabacteroides sp. An277 TaxID=1965619 RepID=UPI000B3787D9|nr:DUF4248 domain-containing protein [Parabacteroides sp. An277]OUO49142.1 hypothetical protein B5F77_15350 [Parabacteroides sp. An277]